MKTIEYRATGSEGEQIIVQVQARDINAGFGKAARIALERIDEIHSVEFWQVCDQTLAVSAETFNVRALQPKTNDWHERGAANA